MLEEAVNTSSLKFLCEGGIVDRCLETPSLHDSVQFAFGIHSSQGVLSTK